MVGEGEGRGLLDDAGLGGGLDLGRGLSLGGLSCSTSGCLGGLGDLRGLGLLLLSPLLVRGDVVVAPAGEGFWTDTLFTCCRGGESSLRGVVAVLVGSATGWAHVVASGRKAWAQQSSWVANTVPSAGAGQAGL